MIVCHCRVVSHTTVLDAIDCGARCPDEVAARCGAGSVCGGCRPTVASLFAESALVGAASRPLPARHRGTEIAPI